MVTTGRTLDRTGRPRPGTGFDVDADDALADLLARRTGALTSHPTQSVWSAPLPAPAGEDETVRSLGIHEPGFDGPPEHYHEHSEERFEVRAGEAVFHVDGRDERVVAGESITVAPGERHTFSIVGDTLCHMIVDIRSPGKLSAVLPTLGGIAHDEAVDADHPLQQAAIARRLDGNTVFTEIPPTLSRPLNAFLGPIARLRGYRGAYAKYTQDAFWERHVEQPEF